MGMTRREIRLRINELLSDETIPKDKWLAIIDDLEQPQLGLPPSDNLEERVKHLENRLEYLQSIVFKLELQRSENKQTRWERWGRQWPHETFC